jgi:hypothetical protein
MTFLLIAAAIPVLLVVPWEVALVALGIALVVWQPWLLLVVGALGLIGAVFALLSAVAMKMAPLGPRCGSWPVYLHGRSWLGGSEAGWSSTQARWRA